MKQNTRVILQVFILLAKGGMRQQNPEQCREGGCDKTQKMHHLNPTIALGSHWFRFPQALYTAMNDGHYLLYMHCHDYFGHKPGPLGMPEDTLGRIRP